MSDTTPEPTGQTIDETPAHAEAAPTAAVAEPGPSIDLTQPIEIEKLPVVGAAFRPTVLLRPRPDGWFDVHFEWGAAYLGPIDEAGATQVPEHSDQEKWFIDTMNMWVQQGVQTFQIPPAPRVVTDGGAQ